MAQSATLIKAKGLITFSNELSVPEGALVKAVNVNVDEDGVITPRRGFADFKQPFLPENTFSKNLITYKNLLFCHFENKLTFEDDISFTELSTSIEEVEPGYRLKYQESNNNLYLATKEGIKKIAARNSNDLNINIIEDAGIVPAYDISGTTNVGTGFLPPESKVAYRVVFGRRDLTNNLLLSAPSAREVVTNLSLADNANVTLNITLPVEINQNYFYQIYRTSFITKPMALTFDDIDPGDEMNLVLEAPITESHTLAGQIVIQDVTPESFRQVGAFLYTNQVSGQGIAQSNNIPPIAKDVSLFRGSMFYGNTISKQSLDLSLITVSNIVIDTTELIIVGQNKVNVYTFSNAEDAALFKIKKSDSVSVSQSIDETARSIVRVINRDPNGIVYARYVSTEDSIPGQIVFEARSNSPEPFLLASNWDAFLDSTSPNLLKKVTIDSIKFTAGPNSQTVIEAVGSVPSQVEDYFIFSNEVTPTIIGYFKPVSTTADEIVIDFQTTTEADPAINSFFIANRSNAAASSNVVAPNRLYFSKVNQPEAVPLLNFISIGQGDEPIERILALRDNLFVLKTDGVFIVDGVSAPNFSSRLLDNSATIIAPDTAVVLNNQIYCLTTQGVAVITESGVSIISRYIEDQIKSIINSRVNYRLTSFALGYESDRAYLLWLPRSDKDSREICFRYNYFEQTWTNWDIPASCAILRRSEDKIYIGSKSREVITVERKSGLRVDYADRDFKVTAIAVNPSQNKITLNSVVNLNKGDVLVQEQIVTIYRVNSLLRKLDIDFGVPSSDYEELFSVKFGDNIQDKLALAVNKLALEDTSNTVQPTVFNVDIQIFADQFNDLVDQLNNPACITSFKNYSNLDKNEDKVFYETIIESVDQNFNFITYSNAVNFYQGEVTVYKAFNVDIQWSPQAFGDPSVFKQVREGTIIFDQNNFNSATLGFSSDLSTYFEYVDFNMTGTGEWGMKAWGSGLWGGDGNDVPFRTYIPQNKQRLRYLNVRFLKITSREFFRILGISAVVRPVSTRAYQN
jgi:hypothetical protein